MGLRQWWTENRKNAELTRRSVELNEDESLIALQVPELAGMGFVAGGAHILKAIQAFRETCTPQQQIEFSRRLQSSNDSWAQEGLTMPYWGSLWVLRTYQAELESE